jgi:hypothetical protein
MYGRSRISENRPRIAKGAGTRKRSASAWARIAAPKERNVRNSAKVQGRRRRLFLYVANGHSRQPHEGKSAAAQRAKWALVKAAKKNGLSSTLKGTLITERIQPTMRAHRTELFSQQNSGLVARERIGLIPLCSALHLSSPCLLRRCNPLPACAENRRANKLVLTGLAVSSSSRPIETLRNAPDL